MFFPIMVDVEKLNILVVGGGRIALRKVTKLIEFGARPRVVSTKFCEGFKDLSDKLDLLEASFDYGYLDGVDMVYLATDDKVLNKEISSFCSKNSILVNSVDDHSRSSFINMGYFKAKNEEVFPIDKEDEIIIAVSAMGKNPRLVKKLVEKLKKTRL